MREQVYVEMRDTCTVYGEDGEELCVHGMGRGEGDAIAHGSRVEGSTGFPVTN